MQSICTWANNGRRYELLSWVLTGLIENFFRISYFILFHFLYTMKREMISYSNGWIYILFYRESNFKFTVLFFKFVLVIE